MPKTLLLADDSVVIQKHVGLSFANEDVELVTTDNGDDALARALELRPDLVLADVVMPGKNGYEVCHAIKNHPEIGTTPVLGMPGYPTSCLSNAYMLLVPMLRRMARLPSYRCHTVSVPAAQRFVSTTGRHQFYTVRVVDGLAVPAFKASGDITSMSQADGYIEIPAQTDLVEKGETVVVKLF